MSDYDISTSNIAALKSKLVLPKFQRSLVWNENKKMDLIKSLHRGFPFGTLLTYQKFPNGPQSLLDGQQRWSTINDYKENIGIYWSKLKPEEFEAYYLKINKFLKEDAKLTKEQFINLVADREKTKVFKWLEGVRLKDNFVNKNQSESEINEFLSNVYKEMSEYFNIDNIQIPIIKYTGDEGNKALVFENLNKGGVPLTKFEIYAAAWVGDEIKLGHSKFEDEILEDVKKYYVNKQREAEEQDFSLDDFSEDELTKTRTINLYEVGFSIGMFAQSRIGSLVQDKTSNINEIGFGLLGISLDTDPRKLENIPKKIVDLQQKFPEILQKIDRFSEKLSSIFEKLIKQNTKKNNEGQDYHRKLNSSYKTLSYFAALWEATDIEQKAIIKNIPAHYVYDSLIGYWSGTGDSKLYEFYPSQGKKKYLAMPKKDAFRNHFHEWIINDNTQKEKFTGEVKSFSTIHANLTYLSDTIDFSEPLEFEHIFPRKRVQQSDPTNEVVLGRLGNAMYLPKSTNGKKKTKTLYEYDETSKFDKIIKDSHYPSKKDFEKAFAGLDKGDFDTINDLILKRADIVATEIVDKLVSN